MRGLLFTVSTWCYVPCTARTYRDLCRLIFVAGLTVLHAPASLRPENISHYPLNRRLGGPLKAVLTLRRRDKFLARIRNKTTIPGTSI